MPPCHPLDVAKQTLAEKLPALSVEQRQAEVRLLVEAVFQLPYSTLLTKSADFFTTEAFQPAWQQLHTLLEDRTIHRTPLQYLLKQAWFLGRPFFVSPAVLIPRPETELLVEAALGLITPSAKAETPFRWADVGTGSGCLAISLALALQEQYPSVQFTGVATDISPEALQVAQHNADELKVASQAISFLLADVLTPLDTSEKPPVGLDLILSNPPYINPILAPTLAPEVLKHEPAGALFSGDCGFEVVRKLIVQASIALKPDGFLLIEVGSGMAKTVADWAVTQASFTVLSVWSDDAGHERFLTLQRKG